jgi:hypothetical protein
MTGDPSTADVISCADEVVGAGFEDVCEPACSRRSRFTPGPKRRSQSFQRWQGERMSKMQR